ncbi:GNAT family N-acetyltransferase [Moraxella sp. FZLJ2107]|uniref:GNAT family N-acetyltransferase n=1 Tax=unclassified Moraxella TaxID=2685852 RepID=UPI0020C83ED9|nr:MULTISPECIES: GNAT family N-acetyltransferase [unclassified Moraxella]UTO04706.1 GNAT family N-acetyltransferase [Moraxella sp. FZLJ2107]UTO21434.1 GNAT family N-acetyltransferase [Moraxella sp. FZLJ2109]
MVRPTEPYDHQGLYDLYRQPEVYRQTLALPSQSLHSWEKRLSAIPSHVHSFVALLDNDDEYRIVGNVALTIETAVRRRHAGSIVIAVSADSHGQGIGTMLMQTIVDLADNWLDLSRLELQVYTDNTPAIALYEKFGFINEGTLRNYAYRDGKLCDLYMMARTKNSSDTN